MLQTKIFLPKPKPTTVFRPRLTCRISDAFENRTRLLLLVASAGYGKSSLLSEWASLSKLPVAWISLDTSENDPIQFVTYLIGSLDSIGMPISSKFKETLKLQKRPPIRKLLQAMIPDILNYAQEFALILDDFHLIDNREIIEALCELISDMPTNMRLVISGRRIPDIPCARLRSRDEVLSIDEEDLRFTQPEIGAYYESMLQIRLSPEALLVIEKRTEGWVTALQLIGLAIKNRPDVNQFIQGISTTKQEIEQYLIEEVLSTLNAEIQSFLFYTAHLDRFSLPLIEHIFDNPEAAYILEEVLQSKLFIIPLDDQGEWFRYHHLFADMLRSRYQVENPQEALRIHARAAAWFRKHHYWAESIQHALHAEQYDQAASDIEKIIDHYWQVGEASQLLAWIEALPDDLVYQNPNIGLFLSWVQYQNGNMEEGASNLEKIKRCLEDADHPLDLADDQVRQLKAIIATQEAAYHSAFGDPRIALEKADLALSTISPDASMWLGISWNAKGVSFRAMGRCDQAIQAFIQAAETHRQNSNIYGFTVAITSLANQYYEMGYFNKVYETCQQALHSIKQYDKQFIPLGVIYLHLAKVLLEWGEFTQAEAQLFTCIDIFIEAGDLEYLLESYYHLALLSLIQYGPDQALEVLSQAAQVTREKQPPILLAVRFRAYQAKILALSGQVNKAAVSMNTMDLDEADRERFQAAQKELAVGRVTAYVVASNFQRYTMAFEKLTQSLLLTLQGYPYEALVLLQAIEVGEPTPNCNLYQLEKQLLQVIALSAAGQKEASLKKIKYAVDQSRSSGLIFTYLQYGAPIRELLVLLLAGEQRNEDLENDRLDRVKRIAYITKLLSAFELVQWGDNFACTSSPEAANRMVNALTSREEEVLQFLAKGYSYQEIGEKLSVTENTIRTHIRGLYNKLEVNNRVLAITKAHELGLIEVI